MEYQKKEFRMYRQGKEIQDQFYLDEDFNVPDAKRDVQRVILCDGKVEIEDTKRVENYIRVSGKVNFNILYVTDEGETKLTSLEGKLPFEEMVYTEEEPMENIFIKSSSAEVMVNVIHSRKLNLKATIGICISSDGQEEIHVLSDIEDPVSLHKRNVDKTVLNLYTVKKDTYRIKEEIAIGGTKETIGTLLWSNVMSRKMDTRISSDEILIQGELLVFCFYESIDGKIDWIEQIVPYQGKISCYGVTDSMFHEVYSDLKDINLEVRMDEDGEMRAIGIEATLEMRVMIYEEEEVKILEDLYSLEKQCVISREEKKMEQLLMQNHTKCKVCERLSLPEIKDDILQICHSSARIQIDHTEIRKEGLQAEGTLHVNFLYVKPDDVVPFDVWQGMIPFMCLMESNETCEDMTFNLTGTVEQLSIGLLGNDEIEVKAVIAIQSFMKKPVCIDNIETISFQPVDLEEQEKLPGIIGYIVKDEDRLWDLAKKYHTTEESIMQVNQLEKEELKCGQKILIFRENVSIL